MDKKLKIGIIGNGGICTGSHVPAYLFDRRAEITALCDIIPERAEKLKNRYFKNAKIYTDYNELINDPEVESVDICTPNYLHSPIAVAALNAGKHVLCEKPDAVGVPEVLAMKEAAEKSGKTLMVVRNNRYYGTSEFLHESIKAGDFGEIYSGRCGWVRRRGIPGKGGWFTTKAMSGGGPLIDLGVHMIDLAVWLMGNPTPVSVSGCTFSKFSDNELSDSVNSKFGDAQSGGTFDVEDLAMGFIRFDNGACLQIEFSWASNIKEEKRFVELRGEKAGLSWVNGKAEVYGEKGTKLTDTKVKKKYAKEGHMRCISHYLDVVLDGKEPVFVPQQGVDMIKILTAVYESAKTGKEVRLD